MKEVDTHVGPEVVRDIFSIIKQSNTEKECKDLPEVFDSELTVSALNSVHPDKPVNILHTLAVSDHCSIILPHLIKYIEHSLYQDRNHQGDTPLKVAISSGRLDNAKVLVDAQRIALKEKGCNPNEIKRIIKNTVNIQDNNGGTALHTAAYAHRPAFIKFLLDIGSDTTIKDNERKIAIIKAAEEYDGDNRMIKTIACLVKDSRELDTIKYNGKSLIGIIRNTQRISWGDFQERELRRECDSNKKICCTIL